jgi:hypothetical protein
MLVTTYRSKLHTAYTWCYLKNFTHFIFMRFRPTNMRKLRQKIISIG